PGRGGVLGAAAESRRAHHRLLHPAAHLRARAAAPGGEPMIIRSVTRHAVMLGLFAVATAATLAITNDRTVDRIACNRQQALEASLKEVMPPAYFDNDLVADRIT